MLITHSHVEAPKLGSKLKAYWIGEYYPTFTEDGKIVANWPLAVPDEMDLYPLVWLGLYPLAGYDQL